MSRELGFRPVKVSLYIYYHYSDYELGEQYSMIIIYNIRSHIQNLMEKKVIKEVNENLRDKSH